MTIFAAYFPSIFIAAVPVWNLEILLFGTTARFDIPFSLATSDFQDTPVTLLNSALAHRI